MLCKLSYIFLHCVSGSLSWSPEYFSVSTKLHDVTSRKTAFLTPIVLKTLSILITLILLTSSGVPRGCGVWGVQTPPKFRRPSKIVPNSTWLWKLLKIAEFRTPTPQDVRKKGSKILKLPSVRNCFTLAMTNKLVVIINSFKVPKIKKILVYEMKYFVANYSCHQNPWLGGCRSRPPFPLSSVRNRIYWFPAPRTKFLGTPLIASTCEL